METPEAAAPTKKLKKGLSKVFGRKDSDSDDEAGSVDATSGVGETEKALDGHLFSVGVAFAQVCPLLLCISSQPPSCIVTPFYSHRLHACRYVGSVYEAISKLFLAMNACTDRAASIKLPGIQWSQFCMQQSMLDEFVLAWEDVLSSEAA